MPTEKEGQMLIFEVNNPLTGEWNKDQGDVEKIATQSTSADKFYKHVRVIEALFHKLTYGTPSAPDYPQRKGLIRKVHDELYPIAFFSKLYFALSPKVLITWHKGNQNFDAAVKDQRSGSCQSNIHYLEVTTLQDETDANQLKQLSEKGSIIIEGNLVQENHERKIELLRKALEKKGSKKYPENTALLIYTDEDRFHHCFGISPPPINKTGDFEAVLRDMKDLLRSFSHVFVYSKNEIYCMFQPHTESSNAD
ncbi:hypothetical protein [Undibacterium rugosum]|uniref:hypothetical protein n=1 Tax=Undibacterium rugosum TaxID=2762291 RepID=UPI001B815ABE|nr:hypothetical protein [Undibacterium rugosum]MBR7777953.1 hypothetical protein [Undibacterium rugosum]